MVPVEDSGRPCWPVATRPVARVVTLVAEQHSSHYKSKALSHAATITGGGTFVLLCSGRLMMLEVVEDLSDPSRFRHPGSRSWRIVWREPVQLDGR